MPEKPSSFIIHERAKGHKEMYSLFTSLDRHEHSCQVLFCGFALPVLRLGPGSAPAQPTVPALYLPYLPCRISAILLWARILLWSSGQAAELAA